MLKIIELFSGIGAQAQALKNAKIEFQTVAVAEIDPYAISAYNAIHGKTLNLGDVSLINPNDVPDCDLLTYSFPCQDISGAGLQAGLSEGSGTRSSLLWECKKIINAKRPKYLVLENVKNLVSATHKPNFDKWLDWLSSIGYTNYWQVLNAVDYGAPQNRERVFVVSILNDTQGFTFPKKQPRTIKLKDILDPIDTIPQNMFMNDRPFIKIDNPTESENGLIQLGNLNMAGNESIKRVYSPEGVCPTLTTMGGGHRQPKIYQEGTGVRKLTPRECWKVMGFSDNEFNKVCTFSNTQLYKMAGNSIAVPCLEAIFKEMFKNKQTAG